MFLTVLMSIEKGKLVPCVDVALNCLLSLIRFSVGEIVKCCRNAVTKFFLKTQKWFSVPDFVTHEAMPMWEWYVSCASLAGTSVRKLLALT